MWLAILVLRSHQVVFVGTHYGWPSPHYELASAHNSSSRPQSALPRSCLSSCWCTDGYTARMGSLWLIVFGLGLCLGCGSRPRRNLGSDTKYDVSPCTKTQSNKGERRDPDSSIALNCSSRPWTENRTGWVEKWRERELATINSQTQTRIS